jgi:hypothetical protein
LSPARGRGLPNRNSATASHNGCKQDAAGVAPLAERDRDAALRRLDRKFVRFCRLCRSRRDGEICQSRRNAARRASLARRSPVASSPGFPGAGTQASRARRGVADREAIWTVGRRTPLSPFHDRRRNPLSGLSRWLTVRRSFPPCDPGRTGARVSARPFCLPISTARGARQVILRELLRELFEQLEAALDPLQAEP